MAADRTRTRLPGLRPRSRRVYLVISACPVMRYEISQMEHYCSAWFAMVHSLDLSHHIATQVTITSSHIRLETL